jgi:aspartyl/glutamyl-tRNA(Asn/Gln) amidotransferase C subunit
MIDEKALDGILFLSRLSIDEAERREFVSQVGRVLDYFKILERFSPGPAGVDLREARPVSSLRRDEAVAGLSSSEVESFAVRLREGYFSVPKILGEGTENRT